MPACSLIWIWFTEAMRYSTGSSMVITLRSGLLISASEPYSVVVLPLPVGPAQITMPYGARSSAVYFSTMSGGMPSWPSRTEAATLVEQPQDDLLAIHDRGGGHADVHRTPSISMLIWPSCGRRRSTMFIPARIFTRLTTAGPIAAGQLEHVVQRAVDAVPHPDRLPVRLDVDVRGAVTQSPA